MQISTKGRYGLRVMIELALRKKDGQVLVYVLSHSQGISANYVHNILNSLKRAGLVRAVRGPKGGYELAKPAEKITALDVVSALEGEPNVVFCVGAPKQCPRSEGCVSKDLWVEVSSAVSKILGKYTLADLARRQKDRQGAAASTFEI